MVRLFLGRLRTVARYVTLFIAVIAVGWWFRIVHKEQVFELGILLVPECRSVYRSYRLLVGQQMAKIYVVTFYCLKFIEFTEVRDVFLVLQQLICLLWVKMESGMEKVIPHRHPLRVVGDDILFGFLKAKGG